MSKKVGYIAVVSGLALLGLSLPLMNLSGTARADEAKTQEQTVNVVSDLVNKTVDETVYVFLDADGEVKKTISSDWSKNDLGADVYSRNTGKVSTPVTMKVSYVLDGKEVTAEELRGRSGHVVIRYDFTNNDRVNGMYVPYAALSGAVLPNGTFSNVKLTNAKLINDGSRTVVAGLALPGLKENLGVDINIPEYFEIEADVKDFKMEMTATIVTSRVFAEIDTSALNSVDALSAALQTLSDSMLQLLNGSAQLRDGLATLNDKTGALADGVSQLRTGSLKLVDGTSTLSDGLGQAAAGAGALATKIGEVADGAKQLDQKIGEKVEALNQGVSGLAKGEELANGAVKAFGEMLKRLKSPVVDDKPNPLASIFANMTLETYEKEAASIGKTYGSDETVSSYLSQLNLFYGTYKYVMTVNNLLSGLPAELTQLKEGTSQLANGLPVIAEKTKVLSSSLSDAATGANTIATGMASLDAGLSNLQSNVPALTSGVSQLAEGSKSLTDGLSQFNDAGVQKLVSLYNGNVKALISKIQMMVNLSKNSSKTKYIYRTDEI